MTCTFASDCTCNIKLYYVLPYKAKISAQHGTGFILDRCIVYLILSMPNLQKKRLLIFEIFNIKKCTHLFLEPSMPKYRMVHENNECFTTLVIFADLSFLRQAGKKLIIYYISSDYFVIKCKTRGPRWPWIAHLKFWEDYSNFFCRFQRRIYKNFFMSVQFWEEKMCKEIVDDAQRTQDTGPS